VRTEQEAASGSGLRWPCSVWPLGTVLWAVR